MKNSQIKANLDRLVQNRKPVEAMWQDIERYVCPYRGKFYEPQKDEGEFEWFRPQRMDDTAVIAHDTLASTLHAKLTPSSYRWFNHKFRDTKLNKKKSFAAWLEDCGVRMNAALADSTFDESIGEMYQDFTSYHTAFFAREVPDHMNWDGLDFKCLPLKECFAEVSHRGNVIRFFRKMQMTILQITDRFGVENIPDRFKELFKAYEDGAGSDTKYTIVYACYKRPGAIESDKFTDAIPPLSRPYGYKFIDYDSGEEIGEEGGYYSMPVYWVRFKRAVGSDFGHGPSMTCMSNIKSLNRLRYLHIKQLELQVNPPGLTTEDNLITDLNMSDGGLTLVEDVDAIKPYQSGGRLDVSEATINAMQQEIKDAYFINKMELKESPAMTATEVGARQRQSQETMSAPVSALTSRLFKPLLNDIFADMFRMGEFDDMPEGLGEADFDIEYSGSAALAQKADIVGGIERTIGSAAGLAEVYEDIMDNFDPDEVAQELGSLNGAPASIYRGDTDKQGIRDERNKQKAAAAGAENAQAQASAMKDEAAAMSTMEAGQGAGLTEAIGGLAR